MRRLIIVAGVTAGAILAQNGRMAGQADGRADRTAIRSEIARAAARHAVDPRLADSVAKVESRYEPRAVSPKGAVGVMQLMPATARTLGVNPWDYRQNIDAGVRYLRLLQKRYPGNVRAVLAAYNAGPSAVEAYGGIPPYPETEQYVGAVLSEYAGRRIEVPKTSARQGRSRSSRAPVCVGVEVAFDAAGRLYYRSRVLPAGCPPTR